AAWHLGWEPAVEISGNHWQAPYLAALLDDPYLAVRFMARRSLRKLPGFNDFPFDFLGPKAEIDGAFDRALHIWRNGLASRNASETPGDKAPPEFVERLLLSPEGTLDRALFDRLKTERDDKPVSLAE
ncbi:MAG: hypothetical protein HY290_31405, partial [Planctomycetia bacterium]|nr:hypothetical protein [Planctomycetia bacterium]